MIDLSKDYFFIEDENGNSLKHDILFSFDGDNDGNTYIVYTADEKDEAGDLLIYASYINEEKYGDKLMNIEDDETFNEIEQLLTELMERVRAKQGEKSESTQSDNRSLIR